VLALILFIISKACAIDLTLRDLIVEFTSKRSSDRTGNE